MQKQIPPILKKRSKTSTSQLAYNQSNKENIATAKGLTGSSQSDKAGPANITTNMHDDLAFQQAKAGEK